MNERTPGPVHTPAAGDSQRDEQVSQVEAFLTDVYGPDAVKDFDDLWREHPEWSLEQAITGFSESPVSHQTSFFREGNLRTTGCELIASAHEETGREVKILDVGCSSGEEPYSIAIYALDSGQTDFSVSAIDVTREIVTQAEAGEYKQWVPDITHVPFRLGKDLFKQSFFDKNLLVDNGKRWQPRTSREEVEPMIIMEPGDEVRKRVTFDTHDILEGPYPGRYDIAVLNNILLHYPAQRCDQILRNVLSSLRPGGFIVIQPSQIRFTAEEAEWLRPYNEWRNGILARFPLGLVETKDWGDKKAASGSVYRFLGWDSEKPPTD